MNRTTAPTLHDVARMAGVSTATVSRCFNLPDRVSAKTRETVMRAVEELGYTPHFGGRALASNRSNTMGAVIPTMENAIFARGLQAFQETLGEAGITLVAASSGYDPAHELEQIRTLVGRGIDGLLLIGAARPDETYAFLERRRIPYVMAWSYQAGHAGCFVGFDNRRAAMIITRKVIELGHRHIAMIAGITNNNDRASDRVDGVRAAELLETKPHPTAIICGNDVLAVGAITKAKELGLRVPGDLSVTGFDDIELARAVEPKLTTMHVPHRRMGQAAARALLAIRDGATDCPGTLLKTQLIMRGSLAAPA
jgi:LacI family transcriptional regulator